MVLSTAVRRLAEIPDKPRIESRMFIDGRFSDGASGTTFETVYPATNELLANVAQADEADVDRAVAAARREFDEGPWPRMSPGERARILVKFADLIDKHRDELVKLNTLDNAKTMKESLVDVLGCAGGLRGAASMAGQLWGRTAPRDPNYHYYTVREPIGVVAGLLAYNAPLIFATGMAAPALAAGNTIVLKPSPNATLAPLRYAELGHEAGLPAGVLSVVMGGNDVATWLAGHKQVDMISLIGSVVAGARMLELAAPTIKKVLLELGGKSAHVIFEDADLEKAPGGILQGIFRNSGQRCFSGSRLLVQKSVYDRVVSDVVALAETLRQGDPFDPRSQLGSLVSRAQLARVSGYVEGAKQDGAEVVTGGRQPDGLEMGNFYCPTVLANVDNTWKVAQEEIFGPVLCAIPFEDEADAIRIANDTNFGLSGGLWTRDLGRAHRVVNSIRTGMLYVNTYAAGGGGLGSTPYKQSGLAGDTTAGGIGEYTYTKTVVMDLNGLTEPWFND